jgi:predicted Zn-dependent protease
MKKLLLPLVIVAAFLMQSCSTVAVTGRKQLNLVSDSEVLTASLTQYSDYMKTAKKSTNSKQTAQVVRVGKKIAAATEKYLTDNGMSNELKNFSWEFSLVQSDEVNAFCMPGGKIVVYEGIMDLISSDDELAVVMGHEVAHVVAKHSNERMSQQVLAEYGSQALNLVLSGKSSVTQQVASTVYGLGAQYGVMLPYSRKHEIEADYMGLVFMELSGYKLESATAFWQKMSAGGSSTPEFLSTHPSDASRIEALNKAIPEVKQKY